MPKIKDVLSLLVALILLLVDAHNAPNGLIVLTPAFAVHNDLLPVSDSEQLFDIVLELTDQMQTTHCERLAASTCESDANAQEDHRCGGVNTQQAARDS